MRAVSKYRQLVDQARDVIYQTDAQGRFTFVNPIATRLMGYSQQELLGRRFIELIRPNARAAAERFYGRQFVRKTPSTYYEFPALTKDGREIWFGQNAQTLLKNGRVAGFHAMARDITERKRTEEARRESELQMRLFMEATADCIWNWDLAAAHVARNVGFERLLGYAAGEIVPTIDWWTERIHPDDRERVWATYGDAVASGHATCTYEYRFRRRDGSYAIVNDHVFIVRDGTGKVVRALGAMTDITERKRAEEALKESEERFQAFMNNNPAVAFMKDAEGRYVYVNRTYERLFHASSDIIGKTDFDWLPAAPAKELRDNDLKVLSSGQPMEVIETVPTPDGRSKNWLVLKFPLGDASGRRFIGGVAVDMTERKRAEAALRERSRQQAIEAELSLLAVTTPDLSTLLNTAAGLTANALELDYCEVLELLPNGSELRLRASAGWKGDRIGQVWAVETGSLAHAALQASKPVVRALSGDTRFGGPSWLHEHGAVGGMNVSIPGKEGPWGVLGLYRAGTRAFSRDDVNVLQTVSSILATAIERIQAESVLRDANQALRLLSRQLLQVQEDDRRAIARDLHDEIGQSLTAIKLNVERAQRTSDPAARERTMKDCVQITERVLGQVRNLSLDLHPSILDDLGLAYALKWYADRQAERAGLKVVVTADPSLPRLSQDIEITCFRIAQEALTNVVRHARASQADITLKRGAATVELCIQDDGIGFVIDPTSSPAGGGVSVGLTSMQERAKLLGGTVTITSAPRHGTTVMAMLPLLVVSPAGMPAEEVPRS